MNADMSASASVERATTHRTHAVLAGGKPLVQTGGVELVVASAARVLGQLLSCRVNRVVAYRTRLHTFQRAV